MISRVSFESFILALLMIFTLGLLLTPALGDMIAIILLIAGIVLFKSASSNLLGVEEKIVFGIFGYFAVLSLFVYVFGGQSDGARMKLERYLVLGGAILFYFVFSKVKVDVSRVHFVFACSALTVSFVVIFQFLSMYIFDQYVLTYDRWHAEYWLRPSGAVHPMRFSAIALILLSFLCVGYYLKVSRGCNLLTVFAILALTVVIVLSKTRGTWLAFVVIIFMLSVRYMFVARLSLRSLCIAAGLVVIGLGVLSTPHVEERVELAFSDVNRYLEGDRQSSIGARLDMYLAAVKIIKTNPIWGTGLDSYKEQALAIKQATPGMSGDVGRWRNPHNEFLQQWVEKGVLGIFSYTAILFGVAVVFWRLFKVGGREVRYFSSCALFLLAVYFLVGQSVALFEHRVFNLFYCVFIMFFLAQARIALVFQGRGL